ncbi:MAG: hypothetical protein GY853_15295 [PVC group bacterium]|nr:hypothetical protein [PVC group bacterium]
MTYKVLQNNVTSSAIEANDNFYHIGQGSRLPMGGNSLTSTDAVYDLGSSTMTWNNLYCDNLYISDSIASTNKSLWVLLSETLATATTASIEITGLNGDDNSQYMFVVKLVGNNLTSSCHCLMQINGDSATNYGYQWIQAEGAATGAERGTLDFFILTYGTQDTDGSQVVGLSRNLLYTKSGNERLLLTENASGGQGSYLTGLNLRGSIWDNTSDTITSLKFIANSSDFGTGTNIQIWGRN